MRPEVEHALRIDRNTTVVDRRVDITTIGARSGKPRRIEIWFYRAGDRLYLSGRPGPRSWYANLLANPEFTLHLKGEVRADLPARAVPITDRAERRRVFTRLIDDIVHSPAVPAPDPPLVVDDWVAGSPLAEIRFIEEG
ncbi:nitroreductase family deazaflavin-dependent oxidoreductase [Streptomyces sp. NPDC056161]|uniref:nitroreductase family deazaflavin-dependent oxidoreductase n=1 Tax=Streptomyces sp. NPDC056161 TaxID=3345732 RepID=UPI0035DC5B1C